MSPEKKQKCKLNKVVEEKKRTQKQGHSFRGILRIWDAKETKQLMNRAQFNIGPDYITKGDLKDIDVFFMFTTNNDKDGYSKYNVMKEITLKLRDVVNFLNAILVPEKLSFVKMGVANLIVLTEDGKGGLGAGVQ